VLSCCYAFSGTEKYPGGRQHRISWGSIGGTLECHFFIFQFSWHPSIKSSTDRANDFVWANDSTFAFSLCIWSIGRRTLDLQRHVSASLFISEVGLALHLAFVFRGLDGVIILRRHDTAGCGQKMGSFLHLLSSMAHVLQQKGYLPLHFR
jgi:hypothetical protein